MNNLKEQIGKFFTSEIEDDSEILKKYSRDASLFELKPKLVVFPKNSDDIKNLVRFTSTQKESFPNLSLTPRSGGTDMSGGPLNDSIILDLTRYFNHIKEIGDEHAFVEPGVFYKDFEKAILTKDLLLPSYPASRETCTVGGMAANNSAGEKTLIYGKTENYVLELKVILSDGNEYLINPLTKEELNNKKGAGNFEGEIYRQIFELLEKNYHIIQNAKPKVSKNSAGYSLWNVWDKNVFDLTKLFVGSQGTLGIITEIKFRLVRQNHHTGLLVIFLKHLDLLPWIVEQSLKFRPASIESFDDRSLKLAVTFFWGFLKLLGVNLFSLTWSFIPEFLMVLTGGIPKLVLLIEFNEENQEDVNKKIQELSIQLKHFNVKMKVARSKEESAKYWTIRRESYNLLRRKVRGRQSAPFVDDIIVPPEHLAEFLPKLYKILDKYKFIYMVMGHAGEGNLHIVPLMKLAKDSEREKILKASDEVYDLVLKFGGSITAEHNDGIIRTPYLEKMYGREVCKLFEQVKKVFDPKNIFNPGKKVGSGLEDIGKYIKRS